VASDAITGVQTSQPPQHTGQPRTTPAPGKTNRDGYLERLKRSLSELRLLESRRKAVAVPEQAPASKRVITECDEGAVGFVEQDTGGLRTRRATMLCCFILMTLTADLPPQENVVPHLRFRLSELFYFTRLTCLPALTLLAAFSEQILVALSSPAHVPLVYSPVASRQNLDLPLKSFFHYHYMLLKPRELSFRSDAGPQR